MSEDTESPPSSPQQQSDSDGSVSSGDLALHRQPTPVKCRWSLCGEWFEQLELLASHVSQVHAVAGRGGLFYCGWEGCTRGQRGFNARYKMLVHVRTHTNEKPHHCYRCDKSFSRAENLKIHARSHTGERPYVCPVAGCGKAYSNSSDRFKHTRTHSVDKPYVCKVPGCPKRYTDPSSLRKHVKTYRHFPPAANTETGCKMEVEAPEVHENRMAHPLAAINNTRLQDEMMSTVETKREGVGIGRLPVWPGFLHWYEWGTDRRTPFMCSPVHHQEQDKPLDLSVAVRLQH